MFANNITIIGNPMSCLQVCDAPTVRLLLQFNSLFCSIHCCTVHLTVNATLYYSQFTYC